MTIFPLTRCALTKSHGLSGVTLAIQNEQLPQRTIFLHQLHLREIEPVRRPYGVQRGKMVLLVGRKSDRT